MREKISPKNMCGTCLQHLRCYSYPILKCCSRDTGAGGRGGDIG